jgi:formimidoylglutamate deiminase
VDTLFTPDWLLWDGQLRSGLALAVSAEGTVVGVVKGAYAGRRLPGRILLPGLVNGHSHAFQRAIRGATQFVSAEAGQDDFWSWRELMYQAAGALGPDELYAVSRQAFLEMALAGVTCVGEFHYLHHAPDGRPYANPNELALQVIRAARDVGLRIALLRVGYARAGHGTPPNPRQRRFIDPEVETFLRAVESLEQELRGDAAVSVGLAPHSVRAVPLPWLEAIREVRSRPLHMHVAEQPAEVTACLEEHGARPVQLLDRVGLLSERFTAVHGIHLDPDELSLLGRAGATVCACPSTERDLGDGTVRADALLEAGVGVSLGSDSQAQIDLLDEARQLEGHLRLIALRRAVLDPGGGDPSGLARRLLGLATQAGGRSLQLPVGTLSPGAPADFFTVDLRHASILGAPEDRLLAAVVFGAEKAAIREVAVQGRLIVEEGQHLLQQVSATAFAAVMRELF